MFLDFDDHRPEVPRVPSAISWREGALLSLVIHGGLVALLLFLPGWLPERTAAELIPVNPQEPVRFVEVVPSRDMIRPPRRPTVQSDADRRAMTRERAPVPENDMAVSRGNTPEPIVGGPNEQSRAQAASATPPATASDPQPTSPSTTYVPVPRPESTGQVARNGLGDTLRDLQRYLREENFQNERGGGADLGSDVQFDSKGIDFGPWLRRFKNQIERNWLVPQAAELLRGRVVVQFYVHRNGFISDLRVVEPSTVAAFTIASVNALKLSNPTAQLPPDYPDDKVLFTVTFRYN